MMNRSKLRRIVAGSAVAAALLAVSAFAPQPAQALTYYWDPNGAATAGFGTVVGAWNTGAFWNTSSTGTTGGTTTANPTNGDDLIIPQATTKTGNITVTGTKNASSITFAANVGPTVNITGGTAIVIGGTGTSSGIFNLSSGANTVSTTLNINSTVSSINLSNSGAGLLKIASINGLATSGTQTVNIGTSSGAMTLNGAFTEGGGGKVALNFNSSGTSAITLSGSGSNYTGGTTFTAGTVIASTTAALPSSVTPGALVFSGGTLQVPLSAWATSDIDTLLSNATKTSGKLGLDTTSGNLTQWTAFTTSNFGGLGLLKAGTNTLTLNQVNNYTGATAVTGGTLQIDPGGSINNTPTVTLSTGTQLVFNTSGSVSYGGVISGGSASAVNVTQQNGGTLTLSGTNSFQGQLNVSNGTVSIATWNGNASNGPLGGGAGSGGQTILGGSGTTGTLIYTGGTAGSNKVLNLATGGTGVIQIDNASTVMSLNLGSGSQVGGSGALIKTGAGALLLSRVGNTYTGTTTIQAGSLVAGSDSGTGTTGVFGNGSAGALILGNGSTGASDAPALLNGGFTVGRDITVGSVSNSNAYNATIGGSNTSGTSFYTGNIALNTTATNYSVTLQAATGGTVDFNTGTWTTNDKAIAIGSSGNLGTVQLSNNLSTAGGISVNYGSLTLNSAYTGNLAVANSATFSGSGSVNGNVNYTSNAGSTFAGVIGGGSGTLTMNSAGTTLVLTGPNTYSGTTMISAGTLRLSAASNNNIANSAIINVGVGATLDLSGLTSSTLQLASNQTLTGTGTVSGNVTAPNNSTLAPGGASIGALTLTGTVDLTGGGTASFRLGTTGINDQAIVNGALTYGGYLKIPTATDTSVGDSWQIFKPLGGTSGIFTNDFVFGTDGSGSGGLLPTISGKLWEFNYGTGTLSIAAGGPTTGNYFAPAIGGGGSGNWDSLTNVWATTPAVQGTGAQATTGALNFTDAPGTATINGTATAVAGINFLSDGHIIAAGTSSPNLNLAAATQAANLLMVASASTATISAQLTGSNGMTKDGPGTLLLSGDNSGLTGGIMVNNGTLHTQHLNALGASATGSATVQPGATLLVDVPGVHLQSLTINGTVKTTSLLDQPATHGNIELGTVDGSGNTVVAGSLTLGATSGLLDLQDRTLLVHYTQSPTTPSLLDGPVNAIKAALVQGRNVAPGGVFDGPWTGTVGITSTRAANDFAAAHAATGSPNTEFYALGYGDTGKQTLGDGTITNKMLINDAGPNFFDPTANAGRGAGVGSTVFVRYTRVGDATMDGIVGNNDVTVLGLNFDPNYNPAGADGPKQWYDGDFNYNGIVDNNDVTILGLQFDPSNTSGVLFSSLVSQYGASFAASFAQGYAQSHPTASVVPEPGVLTLLGVGALALIRRRRQA